MHHIRLSKRQFIIKYALLCFAFLVVLALFIDAKMLRTKRALPSSDQQIGDDLASVLLNAGQRTYEDPRGRFRMAVPTLWKEEHPKPDDRPYDVVFTSSYGCDVSVIVSDAKEMSFESLLRDIRGIQDRLGLNMNIETIMFGEIPAIKRMINLHYSRIITVDFIRDGLAHEIQLAIPHRYVEQSARILEIILERYQPAPLNAANVILESVPAGE